MTSSGVTQGGKINLALGQGGEECLRYEYVLGIDAQPALILVVNGNSSRKEKEFKYLNNKHLLMLKMLNICYVGSFS